MNSLTFILNSDWKDQKSGAATFTRALLGGLGAAGVDYNVVTMRGEVALPQTPVSEFLAKEALPKIRTAIRKTKVSSLKIALGYFLEVLRDCRHLWRNRKLLRRRVIVVNEFGCETIPIAARLMFPFARVISLAHTHPGTGEYAGHPVRRLLEKICYRSVSDVIYNSAALKDEWEKVFFCVETRHALSPHKGMVIHYGIDMPDLSIPEDYPEKPTGCVDLLCASRFVKWKGHRELITAFGKSEIRNQKSEDWGQGRCRLILVGDGPELAGCIEYAAGNENVIFLGMRDNAARYFNGADIGIQLSIEPEAFGLVFLEAMSRGKAVIGSRIGGIPEVVGECGVLVDPFDIDEAAGAISKLVADKERQRALGECGEKRWREEFTLERMVDEYVEYFKFTTENAKITKKKLLDGKE